MERSSTMPGGRPFAKNPRDTKIGFRVTRKEREQLDKYCEEKNLTQTQVLKEALELLYKTKP